MLDRPAHTARRRLGIGVAAAAVVVAAALVAVAVWPSASSGPSPSPSPAGSGAIGASTGPGTSARPSGPVPGVVYGYLPYWEVDAGTDAYLASTSLSTIGLFSVSSNASGKALNKDRGYQAITSSRGAAIISAAHARGVKVEVVFTSFSGARNRSLFAVIKSGSTATPETFRQTLAATLVNFVGTTGADGLNVDVENVDATLIPGYTAFVSDVRARLDALRPGLSLSVATTAGPIGAAMAAAAIGVGADRDFLMGYDYHYPGSEPGASSPLASGARPERTLQTSLARYRVAGVPIDRVILGLPLYGNSWPIDPASRKFLVRSGAGVTWLPAVHVADRPILEAGQFFDPVASVEVFDEVLPSGVHRRLFYDSPRSLAPKIEWAIASGFAGVGFWALGYDRGWPGYWEMVQGLITPRA